MWTCNDCNERKWALMCMKKKFFFWDTVKLLTLLLTLPCLKSSIFCVYFTFFVHFAFICLHFRSFRIAMSSLLFMRILIGTFSKINFRHFSAKIEHFLKLMTDILPPLVQSHYIVVYPEVFSHCSPLSPPESRRCSHQCQRTTESRWQ